jgi:hypothetical protein
MPPPLAQDRLVRKEVALGVIREIVPPTQHLGLTFCPWLEVQSDDVIFDYAKGLTDGLAPARAEDAESELAQKDDNFIGQGRASIIDWALKDRYSASDVTRYREFLRMAETVRDSNSFPLTIGSMLEDWNGKLARDMTRRRRKLDNRIEWMIMTSLQSGGLSYNDGRIKFTVDYARPANQQSSGADNNSALAAAMGAPGAGGMWTVANTATSDPIANIQGVQQYMYDTYGVRIARAVTSRRVLNAILNSNRFAARSGLIATGTAGGTVVDPKYLIDGWGPVAAQAVVEAQTGLTFIEYDAVYRTRPIGSNTVTNNRFTLDNTVIYLPDENDVAEFDDTEIGFARLLTSPHPEGNWAPGFYEWERDCVDPWGYDTGTGVKAFPVFGHMELTVVQQVL